MGENTIRAQYNDSFIYNDFPSLVGYSDPAPITISKNTTTVALTSDATTFPLTSVCVITATLSIGTFIQSGTIQFKDGVNIIYENVPVINGVATINVYIDKAYSFTAIYSGNEYVSPSAASNVLSITTEKNSIAAHYEPATTPFSTTFYNTDGGTASMSIIANISAKVKNIVHDNSGYFIFKVGSDERKIYATGNLLTSIYTASTSYSYDTSLSTPSFTVDYNNDNYEGTIVVAAAAI
jgi:hypothetical protein